MVSALPVYGHRRTCVGSGRSSYDAKGLSLASFRESSELEFGADDAFILTASDKTEPGTHTLRHLKSRNGECRDVSLRFEGPLQRFTPVAGEPAPPADKRRLSAALASMWASTPAADDDGAEQ